jgi:hypothetical protein
MYCCVYSDGQRNCPKHVEFYSKNKFEKLAHLFGFITRVCMKDLLSSWRMRVALKSAQRKFAAFLKGTNKTTRVCQSDLSH